ncbi:hypothetical protein WA1_48240 [Scytonema hofmannii PCC 7110]|uniref:CHAT domain-containing protein n=1 Tax=Scytonema hofmannii PCC 7110 TaxID=128403 RepID=A0A139WY90_9CYAN|nr:CHAT domain-containing protein [Scytonema hofmannii]KYC37398.1 hypothetical protein WA1_48240 [Scytonema hofmannii PCC 7110]
MPYHRLLKLILLALLALITTLGLPVLSSQQVVGTSVVSQQTSNAYLLLKQGIEFYEAERFPEAVEVWKQAASAFGSQEDNLNLALVLRYLSLAYQHLGQWQDAEEAIRKAIASLHSPNFQLLAHNQNKYDIKHYFDIFAKTLNTLGRLQWSKGEWSEAVETWKQAATTYKKADNYAGAIGSLINQATALQAIGLNSQAQTELQNLEKIIQQQSDPNIKATGLQSLGEALRRIGNLKQSQEVLRKSLQVAQEFQLSKTQGSVLLELGNTERALSNRAIAIGKDAQKYTQAAIAYYQQAANSPSVQLQAELNLLSFFVETGEWSEVVKLQPKIQQLLTHLPPSQATVYAKVNFAQSLTCLLPGVDIKQFSCVTRERQSELKDNPPQAILSTTSYSEIAEILTTAIEQARSLKQQRAESYALGQLGRLNELTKRESIAQNLTQQALLIAEEIQAPDIRYRWEWQMGRLWEKLGDKKRAIAAYKEALNSLKSIRSDLLSINADVQFSFRDNVEPIHRQLVNLLLQEEDKSQPSQENLHDAINVIDSLQLAELENFLNCNLSQTVQIVLDVDKQDLKVKFDKLDPQAAFIYPIILKDRLEVVTKLPKQSFKHYAAFVDRTEVEKTALELRTSILKRNRPEEVREKAAKLYEWLLKPLAQDLEMNQEVKTLVFVLDGVLRNLPMSVIYDTQRQEYLMQKPYALAVLPSLQPFDLRPLQREQLEVLTAGVSEARSPFPALPNVVEELQQIGSVVPAKSLLNPKFTTANLQQQMSSGVFSAVHIATHGKFSSDPEETFILTYDKLLKTNDLNNLLKSNNTNPLRKIELLVLSACETARGDNRATLGLAGIAVRAGARSTLATLWQVKDSSTAELMGQFYKELTNPKVTKAEALHQAQLALFERYKAPYDWSPYILVGNWH